MKLRSGKIMRSFFEPDNQPFKLVLLPAVSPKNPRYEVNIDFDRASKEWRKNKVSFSGGQFCYKNA